MYSNPLLNPMMGGGMNQQGQMRGQKHQQHSPRGKKPHSAKKKGGAFGMGTIENQLMDIIKMQGNCLLNFRKLVIVDFFECETVFTGFSKLTKGGAPGSVPAAGPSDPQANQEQPSDEDRYSRKVFVGGLPPDIDEDEITASFRKYGPLCVDWPHKNESKSYFPPKVRYFLTSCVIIIENRDTRFYSSKTK